MLTEVHHDADRVARVLAELLDVCRLEAGQLHLRPGPVDLEALARVVVVEVGRRHEDLTCDLSFPEHLPHASADPGTVRRVLTNLVENAAKYGDPSGVSVTASHDPGGVTISVADRGAGLPSSEHPQVFTKFFRRDLARPSGAGLGLWLGRRLVEASGGTLTVGSRSGGGTTFRLTLPAVAPSSEPSQTETPAELEQRDR
jgi:signal transduction histidine kinase